MMHAGILIGDAILALKFLVYAYILHLFDEDWSWNHIVEVCNQAYASVISFFSLSIGCSNYRLQTILIV